MNYYFELLGMARGVLEFSPVGPPMATATSDGYRRYALRWLENPGAFGAALLARPRSTQRFAEAAVRHELLVRLEAAASHLRDALGRGDVVAADKRAAEVHQCLDLLREVRPSRRGRRVLSAASRTSEVASHA